MIDSEMCRFVLTRYGIPYRETPHIFGWVSILALFSAGTLQIPVLIGSDYRLVGPRQIVDRFDTDCDPARKLMPADAVLRAQVELDWSLIDGALRFAPAVVAYYYLLPHREIMIEPFTRGLPTLEASFVRAAYPLVSGLFTVLLQLNKTHARKALDQIRALFNDTDARLTDGRRFLVGDTLTLSDLRLATALAPLLLPEGFGSPIPPFDQMPQEMQAIIKEFRQHPTAGFVQRIYSGYRNA
jgi:glutathione S-transferase